MSHSYSKNVSMIGVARQVGATSVIDTNAKGESEDSIIGACPLLTELAWYMFLETFRKLERCTRWDGLPDTFGEGVYSKKAFLDCLPNSFHPNAVDPVEENEFDGSLAMIRVTRCELAEMSDDWRTIRSVICVLKLADRIFMYGPDRIRRQCQSPFDIAAAYYRPNGQPAVKK